MLHTPTSFALIQCHDESQVNSSHTPSKLQSGSGIPRWNITMNFKVPEKILREFVHIAKKNYSTKPADPGHIETMSILVGNTSSSQTVVTKIFLPSWWISWGSSKNTVTCMYVCMYTSWANMKILINIEVTMLHVCMYVCIQVEPTWKFWIILKFGTEG